MRERTTVIPLFFLSVILLLSAGCTSSHPPALVAGENSTATAITSAPAAETGSTCINNLTLCSGFCRDLRTDASNCGMCGIACPSGQVCTGGICRATDVCTGSICTVPATEPGSTVKPPAAGTTATAPTPKPGTTVTATTSVPSTTLVLVTATVPLTAPAASCPANMTSCAGACVYLGSDPGNCGSCGTTCVSGSCLDGKCRLPTSVPTIEYTKAPGKSGITIP